MMPMNDPQSIPITPETKVAALLEAYPALETVLFELAPAFRKLQNPVLRRTVGRVASLRQAAAVGNVPLGDMINRLRRAAGQAETPVAPDGAPPTPPPPWLDRHRVARTIDARPLLEAGQQPVSTVMAEWRGLAPGETLLLLAPFHPAPLLDLASAQGFEHWCEPRPDGVTACYLRRTSPPAPAS